MTALDRREGIIDAAKDDARAAVDQLLDAIGRILLAHLDAHETTTPPPPPPSVTVTGTRWTPEEDALLREHHPQGGPAGVRAAGVNRSSGAIRERARTPHPASHPPPSPTGSTTATTSSSTSSPPRNAAPSSAPSSPGTPTSTTPAPTTTYTAPRSPSSSPTTRPARN